jgi:hypothetical protein
MPLREAIDRYHELLTGDVATDSQGQLDEQLQRRGLFFGDRPLCTVLRPRFMSAQQYEYLQARAVLILRAFESSYRAAMADSGLRAQYGLTAWEEQLIHHDPGFRDASPVSRLDAFFVGEAEGLRFTEYNAETPAGAGYNDVLSEMFYGLPVMAEFLRDWDVRPLPARHNTMHALLDAYRQWSGRRDRPRIAILDWAEVPTRSEFILFKDYFERQGLTCVIVDPADCEYRNGRLEGGGGPIDLIYKRVLITELVDRCGIDHAVVRAVRDQAVCMVNPFRCKMLHKKTSLAVLSDERNARLFSAAEREAIAAHIPWTRRVEDRSTVHHTHAVDLLSYISANRSTLVLKPNDEYGGKGILLGWETDQGLWDSTIRAALTDPHIVQERVALPKEPFPSMDGTTLRFADRMLDTAPYVGYGRFVDGCLSRLSTAALLNVTAGGGSSVPTFVINARRSS